MNSRNQTHSAHPTSFFLPPSVYDTPRKTLLLLPRCSPITPTSTTSDTSPSLLCCTTINQAYELIDSQDDEISNLSANILSPSKPTKTTHSTYHVQDYALRRNMPPPSSSMYVANDECVKKGQVWRMTAVTVHRRLLQTPSPIPTIHPYVAISSMFQPNTAIVWRDIYDMDATKNSLSIKTRVEMAAAGRVVYHWINNRHRTIIAQHCDEYIQAVAKVAYYGNASQFKSCSINELGACFAFDCSKSIEDNMVDCQVIKELAEWILYEWLMCQRGQTRNGSKLLIDHYNQICMVHVRGQWAGDLHIGNQLRRRSEIINYVHHGMVVVTHNEIRSCPCQTEEILSTLVSTEVKDSDINTCHDVLSNPGTVKYNTIRLILIVYILLFAILATIIMIFITRSTTKKFEKVTGSLASWTWTLGLVSSVHVILVKNLLPNITLRDIAQGRRRVLNITDMNLGDRGIILFAHDARTNHLLAPGNSSAFANKPSGKILVNEMPDGKSAWKLGLVVTDCFAIKLQQNTPLLRRTAQNLDGSINIDWDSSVEDGVVGRLLKEELKIG